MEVGELKTVFSPSSLLCQSVTDVNYATPEEEQRYTGGIIMRDESARRCWVSLWPSLVFLSAGLFCCALFARILPLIQHHHLSLFLPSNFIACISGFLLLWDLFQDTIWHTGIHFIKATQYSFKTNRTAQITPTETTS